MFLFDKEYNFTGSTEAKSVSQSQVLTRVSSYQSFRIIE